MQGLHGLGRGGLDRVGDHEHAPYLAVPAGEHRGLPGGLGLGGPGGQRRWDGLCPFSLDPVRPACHHSVTIRDAGNAEPSAAGEPVDGRQAATEPLGGPGGDRCADRVPRGVFHRAGQAQDLGRVFAGRGGHVHQAHPPGRDRAGLVQHDGVDGAGGLQHLGPFDQDAELGTAASTYQQRGRRREPHRARAGDDQHRDRRGERGPHALPGGQPPDQRDDGDADDDRDEHGRDPVGQPLHRRLAGLRVRDEPGDLRELGAGAHLGGADHQPTADVHGRAGHPVTGADLGRHGLPGQHRGVDRGIAGFHDPVGCDLLTGPDHEHLTDGELPNRDPHLVAIAQHRDVLGAQR